MMWPFRKAPGTAQSHVPEMVQMPKIPPYRLWLVTLESQAGERKVREVWAHRMVTQSGFLIFYKTVDYTFHDFFGPTWVGDSIEVIRFGLPYVREVVQS